MRFIANSCLLALVIPLAGNALSSSEDPPGGRSITVGTYRQEASTPFGTAEGLPSPDVLAIAVTASGDVFAGTAKGLGRLVGERWERVDGFEDDPVALLSARGERLLVARRGRLYQLEDGRTAEVARLPRGRLHKLAVADEALLATEQGLFVLRSSRFVPDRALEQLLGSETRVRDVALGPGGAAAVAAASGLFWKRAGAWCAIHPRDQERSWAPRDVRAVTFDGEGRLWFAAPEGTGFFEDGWHLFDGANGLPYGDFTCMTAAGDGTVWLGTRRGAIRFDGETWQYRQGRRWLPHDGVRALACTATGDAWFATAGGVGAIIRRPMTLGEKARLFEDEIDRRHRRTPYQYVDAVLLDSPGNTTAWKQRASDNDGLWTSMYGAGECFAYAATGQPDARSRARRAFEALRFLGDVTQGGDHPAPPGFVARTVVSTAGPDPNVGRVERDRVLKKERDANWKIIEPRWPVSADGKWFWKCDTSSDELDGHYFFYARYYDLVAGSEEKEEVREVVRRITDHLIAHQFTLVDHDGRPTRWAHFGPEDLNLDPTWWEERGLNSLSILSYLKVAEHTTGDPKYAEVARELIERHGYAVNVLYPKNQTGPGSGNQSDDEMAFMCFYNLLRYEKDSRRRQIYAYAFYRYFELERRELNPLFNFLYAAVAAGEVWEDPWGTSDLSPRGPWLEEAVDSLKRYPLDRRNWRLTNSHRLDVVLLPGIAGGDGPVPRGARRSGRVLPIDERFVDHWNHDPWALDQGGGGEKLADGASFLLPYYLGLYHRLIR